MVREPKEWKLRLELLKETINKFLENIPEKEVTNEFLFYKRIKKQLKRKKESKILKIYQ
jgi:hypothetical protein